MKTSFLISIFTIVISLTPSISSAKSDDSKYPASNFQPKVIYLDKEVVKTSTSKISMGEKSVYDPKYPAANFEPKVIYP